MTKKLVYLVINLCLIFILSVGSFASIVTAQSTNSNYIVINTEGSQRQRIYIYEQGRLDSEILPDNSIIQYAYDTNGNMLKRSKGSSSEPYIFGITSVSYDIYINGVQQNVQQVHFPTWTDRNGQDDIEWSVGEKLANGVWKGTVVFNKHGGELGTYITHIYADGTMVGSTAAEVRTDEVTVTAPSETSLASGFYNIQVSGIADSIKEVRFPTWTENKGQDDLVNPWITGEKLADGSWRIKVPFSNHNYETGNYITHMYLFDRYGNKAALGGKVVNVIGGTGGSKETDLSGVSYDVFIYGVDPLIQSVQFPTWTANQNQDDIEWIEGVKVGNGVWKGTVVYSKHNSETGRYITHVYSSGKFLGAWEFNVTNSQNLKAPNTAKISDKYYEVTIEGVPGNVTRLEFPTWTNSNGQDDIYWYQGEREINNKWRIRIPFAHHGNETGTYITHLYAHDGYGNIRAVGGVTVNVTNQ
ncbi:GBS Bsp-like repeat-containing protein [Paenibacillus sp. PK3_47]|uniref:GBS Bsp-like repeat-containing protein n=1 Tax=Paenibacillus sp. PK3_47 TaxID=2072642 RepID=UPI00201E4AEF|nr:GBS Bsp-like repeat-containing protein [Paenibacillus sp. PK3_47]